jgi:hypothetical protein
MRKKMFRVCSSAAEVGVFIAAAVALAAGLVSVR